jgi:hypothetical protein
MFWRPSQQLAQSLFRAPLNLKSVIDAFLAELDAASVNFCSHCRVGNPFEILDGASLS